MNAEYNARPKPAGFEGDTFRLMSFVLRAGDILPWGTNEANPESAWVEFWFEVSPGVTKADLHADIRRMVEELTGQTTSLQHVSWRMEETKRFLPGSSVPADSPILKTLGRTFELASGLTPVFANAPFACDAFMFNLYSPTPCVLLGPRGGNAHTQDEWVEVEDLITLTKVYALTIADWLT